MNRQVRIFELLQVFRPLHLEIDNESDHHAGPPGRETHFKLLLVSPLFEGLNRVERQRKVHDILRNEFQAGLHALTQRLLTPAEWEKTKADLVFSSPDCGHKGK
jgi:stress-induced morphogen